MVCRQPGRWHGGDMPFYVCRGDGKNIRIMVLGVAFLLFVVIVCTWILKSAQTEQRELGPVGDNLMDSPFILL